MIKYVAFLRGVNVGGNKVIKMEELRPIFASFDLQNVATYITSGNVIFESSEDNIAHLTQRLEDRLEKALGYKVPLIIRKFSDLKMLIKANPFQTSIMDGSLKLYVCFLAQPPIIKLQLPYFSPSKDIELVKITNCDAFVLSREVKEIYGFPNNFIEKELGIDATTRNWNTVCKIVAKY